MARSKGGSRGHKKHIKIIKLAKGYRGSRSKLFKRANEAVVRAGEHAFEGRKQRKRDMRKLWIARVSAALNESGILYSRFINALAKAKIELNRKMLSEIAIADPKAFSALIETAKKHS